MVSDSLRRCPTTFLQQVRAYYLRELPQTLAPFLRGGKGSTEMPHATGFCGDSWKSLTLRKQDQGCGLPAETVCGRILPAPPNSRPTQPTLNNGLTEWGHYGRRRGETWGGVCDQTGTFFPRRSRFQRAVGRLSKHTPSTAHTPFISKASSEPQEC